MEKVARVGVVASSMICGGGCGRDWEETMGRGVVGDFKDCKSSFSTSGDGRCELTGRKLGTML